MAIKTYKKGDSTKLSPNFRAREFDCPGVGCCKETPIDEKLVEYLQKIRDHFKKPINILAYRCKVYNAKVANAAFKSRHTYGQAADFHIDGVKPAEIAKFAESIGVKGIGLYDDFVHIDTRESKSFWYGHGQEYRSTFGGAPEEICTVKLEVLKKGDKGDSVRVVQTLLIAYGYKMESNGKSYGADGSYGSATVNGVKNFQKKNGLPQTGECDEKTWNKLLGVS